MITRFEGTTKVADVTSSTYDSGWVDVEWTSNFKDYADLPSNGAQVRRIGNIVYLRGIAAPTQTLPTSSAQIMFTLPEGYRPDKGVYAIMQGSGARRWLLIVNSNGAVTVGRYGIDSFENINTGVWLPFNVSYVAGDNQ